MPNRFSPGCRCCGGLIGFDGAAWPGLVHCYDDDQEFIEDLSSGINEIWRCKLVFAGNDGVCQDSIRFANSDWNTIRRWVRSGGRLWINSEYTGCLQDPERLDSFLEDIGSTLRNAGGAYDCGCGDSNRSCRPGDARIATGVDVRMACTGDIQGGVSVWIAPAVDVGVIAVERLGRGYVFLSGDSNIWAGCGYDNCEFTKRLLRGRVI